jgi:hypothetical protein
MSFASPLWLLGLLPWAAVALWMLRGYRRRVRVPFLELWKLPTPLPTRPPKSRWELPPAGAALLLAAMLLAVLGSAGPRLHGFLAGRAAGRATITVVVDTGLTMSARGKGGPRYVEAAELAQEGVVPVIGLVGLLDLVTVPGPAGGRVPEARPTDASDWLGIVRQLPPSAADTRDALRAAVAARLVETDGPVVVISDHVLGIDDARVIQVAPESPLRNAGIVRLSASASPRAQVMVTVRGSDGGAAKVRVTSAGSTAEQTVELPQSGEQRDVFVDLDGLGRTVRAELLVENEANDISADDRAWLVREGSWPRVEPRAAVPAELRRMIEVYSNARPAGDSSRRVAVVTRLENLGPGEAGVVVGPASGAEAVETKPTKLPGAVKAEVREHPVTRRVGGWEAALAESVAVAAPPGFTPVVSAGGAPVVAVRDNAGRQVWVGLDPAGSWARSPEFVVFWANVFDWVGRGDGSGDDGGASSGVAYVAYPVGPTEGLWEPIEGETGVLPITEGAADRLVDNAAATVQPNNWPGLYRSRDGLLRAVNAPPVPVEPREAADAGAASWRDRLAAVLPNQRPSMNLAPGLLVAAVASVAVAALAWRKKTRGGAARQPGTLETGGTDADASTVAAAGADRMPDVWPIGTPARGGRGAVGWPLDRVSGGS